MAVHRPLLIATFSLALISSYGNFALAAAAGQIILGYASPGRALPFWVAQDVGMFTKYGVDVESVFIRGAPILVAALAAGDIQVGSTGGTTWMALLLWLEHFGLDVQRDKMQLQVLGEQALTVQALETGIVNAAVLDGINSSRIKPKGFTVIGEYSDLKHRFLSQALVVQRSFLQQRGDTLENLLKAEIEAVAYIVAPKNKAAAIKTLMRRMRINAAGAEEGYLDLLRVLERKPLPSVESMVHVQRLMKAQNPKIGAVNLDELNDTRLVKKLDDSGFIDKTFAAQGIKP